MGWIGNVYYKNLMCIFNVMVKYICDLVVIEEWIIKYKVVDYIVIDYYDVLVDLEVEVVLICVFIDLYL